jgi:hypothetical protein
MNAKKSRWLLDLLGYEDGLEPGSLHVLMTVRRRSQWFKGKELMG